MVFREFEAFESSFLFEYFRQLDRPVRTEVEEHDRIVVLNCRDRLAIFFDDSR